MSDELFYIDGGVKQDKEIHEEILDNPRAERVADELAVKQAMARGVSREEAERLYMGK